MRAGTPGRDTLTVGQEFVFIVAFLHMTRSCLELYRNIPSKRNTKSHRILPKTKKQPQEAGGSHKSSKASRHAATSMAQPYISAQ